MAQNFLSGTSPTTIDTRRVLLVKILNSINAGGGGGGGAQQVFRDEPVPDDPTLPALSFPSGGGTLTQWDPDLAAWV